MGNSKFKRVLITGTTSGLGRAFHKHYCDLGVGVIEVNKRAVTLEPELPVVHSEVLDITNSGEVYSFLQRLNRSQELPDLFILNAGINLVDNMDVFDYQTFAKVMNINLMGVMTFVGAIRRMHLENKTIVSLSSTSNIIANPAHIGYHISKLALLNSFKLLAENDSQNIYKSVILAPVHTSIQAHYPAAQGLQKAILNFWAISPETATKGCARFFEKCGFVLHYPKFACAFYYVVKILLLFFPFLYKGTKVSSLKLAES